MDKQAVAKWPETAVSEGKTAGGIPLQMHFATACKEMKSEDVRGKREAAKRWANHVSAEITVGTALALSVSGRSL